MQQPTCWRGPRPDDKKNVADSRREAARGRTRNGQNPQGTTRTRMRTGAHKEDIYIYINI